VGQISVSNLFLSYEMELLSVEIVLEVLNFDAHQGTLLQALTYHEGSVYLCCIGFDANRYLNITVRLFPAWEQVF
jgi:hypothetical protein